VDRPRILIVPMLTEVEWKIRPLIEDWAEVASFDAPGVGEEPPTEFTVEAIVERGIAEIDAQGWDSCVIAGDEVGAVLATRIAEGRPDATRALVLGHAAVSFGGTGPGRQFNQDMFDALIQLARTDFRSFVRALSQITQNAYDDELADRYMERVSQEAALRYLEELTARMNTEQLEPALRSLNVPMLLVEHQDCLAWTREGFEEAVAAFPDASTASFKTKPSCEPEFAPVLREFCEGLAERADAPAAGRAS
jgi:pimeloyl-ACP methyl ester carboxylesterase